MSNLPSPTATNAASGKHTANVNNQQAPVRTFLLLPVVFLCLVDRGRAQDDVPGQGVYFPGRPCHEFLCANNVCVSRRVVCNGVSECGDNSDELNCHGTPGNGNTQTSSRCAAHQFSCRDLTQCLYQGYRCDGEADCRDGSDEHDCQPGPTGCLQNQLRCGSGACVPVSYRCDNVADCEDGTDESGCYHPWPVNPPEPTREAPVTATAEGRCNGHSNTVDPRSGHCLNCQHHTMGQRCETCIPGYTGDATLGTPHACTPVIHVCHCYGHSGHCDAAGNCLVGAISARRDTTGIQGEVLRTTADPSTKVKDKRDKVKHPRVRMVQVKLTKMDLLKVKQVNINLDCQHNTEGFYCDRCKPGFRGTALYGTPHDCQRIPLYSEGASPALPPPLPPPQRQPSARTVTDCLHQTEGKYCDRCQAGYIGDARKGTAADCQLAHPDCTCHGHADFCDVFGRCLNCRHNTMGNQCEKCVLGYYGDPARGTPSDCHPCPCPLTTPSNQFSDTCTLDIDGLPTCTRCHPGYLGRDCGTCANGYWGNPREEGQRCVRQVHTSDVRTHTVGNDGTAR
ncbi:hypothetical protein Bbelb_389700 [Branchiostoma belcheri]|nr:hypothetical protein Bbelb_389700 [Branchiostoma belcheri]